MPDLSIKNVPSKELERLRGRAKRNHRSLQGELRVILAQALSSDGQRHVKTTFEEALTELRKVALKTPAESTRMVREDRDER
ncbi:MAG: Arc family DNA-binding protein [Alphaproteobacteria bacterium]|nr:Arc family DNA-binding protein [Alphaproteobacteria bacterium]